MKLLFLDTEATGLDLATDRLCQICYKIGDELKNEYFKPPVPISVKAMSISHVTNKMVADKPAFAESDMKRELEVLLPEAIMVAHNAAFDAGMLEAEGLKVPNQIDTLKVSKHLDVDDLVPEHKLQFLRYFYDLDVEAIAHDAMGDVLVLEAVFGKLLEKMKETVADEQAAIERMVEISKLPSMVRRFMFGKYYGKKVEEVAEFDRGYLEWLLAQKMQSADIQREEDWIFTLHHVLGLPQ